MKLKFKQQAYQNDAAMAVVRCFEGQSKGFRKEVSGRTGFLTHEIFSNKKLELTEDELLKNVKEIQKEQGLKTSSRLAGLNFTVEMETGTGKTYVYTKTMYELNKHCGWSKFIIMVPSVAIREGVHKSLEITAEHFQEIYGKKIRFSIYNTKSKSNLINIKSFADTSNIEVIIMNYQAFATTSKESRKIYQKLDSIQSERPIDVIKRARPILIIDEPQRFGDKAEKVFSDREFNQLFTLRYSATHKKEFNKIYRLDAIDAYNHKLVKKINVKGIEVVGNSGTNSCLFLDRIQISTNHYPVAFIENKRYKVPEKLEGFQTCVEELVQSIYTTADFKVADDERASNINEAVLLPNENFAKKEFQDLWKKLKVKTVYEVDFDSAELVKKSIHAIEANLTIKRVTIHISDGEQQDGIDENSLKDGSSMQKPKIMTERADTLLGSLKYDLIAEIAKETNLTRKTVVKILKGLKESTFYNFRVNPESFIKGVSNIINSEKAATLINNITYSKTDKAYDDDVFTINNFKGSLKENILAVKKHIYDYLKTDSKIERAFASDLECEEVLVYAKLPSGFRIPTPVGNYNPDWAIVFDTDKYKYVYFIAETKGSMETLQLKEIEQKKISYAKKHFEALGHKDIKYDVIDSYSALKDKIMA